jgi:hypothetical protein
MLLARDGFRTMLATRESFEIDGIVGAQEGARGLVMEVTPLAGNLLMLPLQQLHRFAAAPAPLLAPGDPALGFGELLLSFAVVPRVGYHLTISRDQKHLQSHVYARLIPSQRPRRYRHVGTREAGIPAIRLMRHDDGLGRAFKGAM